MEPLAAATHEHPLTHCLQSLAKLLGQPLIALDEKARFVAFSEAAERLTGLGATQVDGAALDRFEAEGGLLGRRLRAALRSAAEPRFEGRWQLGSGPAEGRVLHVELLLQLETDPRFAFGVLHLVPAADGADLRLIGESPALVEALRQLRRVASSEAATLITGESGTGKELAARAVHRESRRSAGPFVAINCAAIPRELIESELFGHVQGAFTGATHAHLGVFEQASGGTLFLDEVGELPPELQAKLLRVLETREIRPLGAERTTAVDVRLVSATHQDPARAMESGSLRADFFYRIATFQVQLPALRERIEDIPLLARHFLRELAAEAGERPKALDPALEQRLQAYGWPGNVRELRNALARASILCEGPVLRLADLPAEIAAAEGAEPRQPGSLGVPPRSGAERRLLLEALQANGWNRTRTAEALGISRVTLWKKIRQHRIDEGTFRGRPSDG